MADNLQNAVEQWIKAEYAFRLGPHAYTDATTKYYEEAERAMRIAATNEEDLRKAAETVGIAIPTEAPKKAPTTRERIKIDTSKESTVKSKPIEAAPRRIRLRGFF